MSNRWVPRNDKCQAGKLIGRVDRLVSLFEFAGVNIFVSGATHLTTERRLLALPELPADV